MGAATGSATGTTNPASASNIANAAVGIATGAATGGPIGAALAIGGATLSFIQASKEQQLQRKAEEDAKKAFEEAKKQININPFDALAINKEPYELERQALLAQGAQAIAAGQEGDRGAAATAGRVQMAQNEAQAGQRTAMGADMLNLEKMSAEEDTNIKNQLANLSLNEAAGYQSQAKEAKDARARAIQQGYQSGAKALEYGLEQVPLYLQGKGDRVAAREQAAMNKQTSANATKFAAGTPQGPSNYVMQDQQAQPLNPSNFLAPIRNTYNPYPNPFLFYQQQQ